MPSLESSAHLYAKTITRFLAKMRPGYPYGYSTEEIIYLVHDTNLAEIAEFAPEMLR